MLRYAYEEIHVPILPEIEYPIVQGHVSDSEVETFEKLSELIIEGIESY